MHNPDLADLFGSWTGHFRLNKPQVSWVIDWKREILEEDIIGFPPNKGREVF